MRFASLALLLLVAVSGCAGAHWSVVDARPLMAVSIAPAQLVGPVDRVLAYQVHLDIVDGNGHIVPAATSTYATR